MLYYLSGVNVCDPCVSIPLFVYSVSDDDDSGSDIDTSFMSNHKRSPLASRRKGSLDSSDTRSRLTSASSYLTDTPSSPRFSNNIDHSMYYS